MGIKSQGIHIKSSIYRWTSLYARYKDSKNRLAYNEFAYKKTKNCCKLEDRFQKKAISGSHIYKIADKKTAYNKDHLYKYYFFLLTINISKRVVVISIL